MLPRIATVVFCTALSLVHAIPALAPSEASDSQVPDSAPEEAYVSKSPVCGLLGFTAEPGDHDIGPLSNQSLSQYECREACIQNASCKAVSYAPNYMLCSFYSEPMNCDHLMYDNTSFFEHFDNTCPFPRDGSGTAGVESSS